MGRRLIARPAARPAPAFLATTLVTALPATLAAATLAAAALATATPAAAQQRVLGDAPADTIAADTVPPDSTLTLRERAIRRLRAMPLTPIDPDPADTLPPDSAADIVVADTAIGLVDPERPAEDSAAGPGGLPAPGDTAAPARGDTAGGVLGRPTPDPDRLPDRAAPGDSLPATPGDTAAPRAVVEPLEPGTIMREDSIRALLRALEGYVVTDYRGEAAVFRADSNQLRLTGQSRVGRESNALETDSVLVYSGNRGVVCGYGNPVMSGETEPVESDRVCFDINRNVGEAVGARTQFVQGATWYVRGAENRVYLLTGGEQNRLYGEKAEFTSCDLPEPHYVFKARSLKMVEGDMMVARNVTLEFEDVPVFWLPWMVQSMKRGRRSGLLMPEFGVNDIVRNSTGYNRHISNLGFYWAINDYLGARGTFEWYSGNWKAVETGLAYHWRRQFLQGQWTAKQYWRDQGRRDLSINTSNNWQPDERTRLQLSGSYVTSTDFVRRSSYDPRELNRRISSRGSVNRSFGWGTMTLGAGRDENIATGQVDLSLPRLTLNLQPITLYSNDEGTLNLTWNGSGDVNRDRVEVREDRFTGRDQERLAASASHSLSFGRLSLNQSVSYNDESLGIDPPPLPADSAEAANRAPGEILLPTSSETLTWSTGLGYQQNLWTGTTLTPSLSINGNQVRNDTLGTFVSAPTRMSAGASLSTTIFGFWPGFSRFSRIRHKISPSLSWQYSPAVDTLNLTAVQRRLFGAGSREQNRLSLTFNQTFEAKVESDDTVDVEDSVVDDAGAPGEPRRLPQAEKVMILSLTTSGPFVYDFVSAREDGRGFLTDRVSNSLRSDLLRDLTLNMSHELFDYGEPPLEGGVRPRTFDPFLTNLNASFRIDDDFWLFKLLGLAAGTDQPDEREQGPPAQGVAESEDPTLDGEMDVEQVPGEGSIVPGRGGRESGIRRGIGGWQASLNYSLSRFRPAENAVGELVRRDADQTLSGNMSFQPTEHWSLRWSTSYSFTAGEFNSHVLTLTRDLHRWQANFDFIRAQNGNFVFTFRVQLTDNPDLKLDYDQRSDLPTGATQTQTRRTQ